MKQETKIEKFSMSGNRSPAQRPKRNIAQKSMDYNNGLLWREEKDLKKALYASLQEGKRRALEGEVNGEHKDDIKENGKLRSGLTAAPHLNSKNNQEASPKRARVHAQRKFAQGSTPNSPAPTPVKICSGSGIATDLLPCRRPKTEDFLTFLCLRDTSILPPSLDFLNNCTKSDSSSDSREVTPEPESFETASCKEFSSKSERDKWFSLKHENLTSLKHAANKCNANKRRTQSSKEWIESESEESIYNMQHQQKGNKEGLNNRKRKFSSGECEVLRSKQGISHGRLRLLHSNISINKKPKESVTSVSALKEKYKQQRLAKQRTKTFQNQKENLSLNSKVSVGIRNQNSVQNSKPMKRTVDCLIKNNVQLTRTRTRGANKIPIENKRLLRSSKIHEELSLPMTRTSAQHNSTPWLRKAKLVPPILDFDSESDSESSSSIAIKKPMKEKTERSRISLRKDNSSASKIIKDVTTKSKVSSVKRAALISTVEHSYVKLPPAERIHQTKSRLCKKYKSVPLVRKKFTKPVKQEHDTLGRTRSSKLNENQTSKRVTRSSKLKEIIASSNETKFEKRNEKRLDHRLSKSVKYDGKVNIDAKKFIRDKLSRRTLNQDKVSSKEFATSEGKHGDQTKTKVTVKNKDANQILDTHKLRKHEDSTKCAVKEKKKMKGYVFEKQIPEKEKYEKFNKICKTKHCDLSRDKISKKDGKTVKDLERISSEDHKYTCRNSFGTSTKKEKVNKKSKQSLSEDRQLKHSVIEKDAYHLALRKKKSSEYFKDFEKLMEDEGLIPRNDEEKLEFKRTLNKSKKKKMSALLYKDFSTKKSNKRVLSKLLNKYSKKKELKKKKLSKSDNSEKDSESSENKLNNQNNIETQVSDYKEKSLKLTNEGTLNTDKEVLGQINATTETIKSENPLEASTSTTVTASIGQNTGTECSHDETETSYIIEGMSDGVATFDAISNEMAQTLPSDLVFGSAEEIQSLMTSEFSGVFDETFTAGAILLTTRDTLTQVPLHFIQELTPTKTMADAATNTCEEDLLACMNEGLSRNEETSVGTQTMTPVGSPLPVMTDVGFSDSCTDSSPKDSSGKMKSSYLPKPIGSPGLTSMIPARRRSRTTSFSKKLKLDDTVSGKDTTTHVPQQNPKLSNAPIFYPSQKDFLDPLEYIKKIQPEAEKFGICKIIPPSTFKPECKVNDDMRFTAHNQYVHKMLYRWGPNVKHVACVKRHLRSQGVTFEQAPLIGGIELDLSKFYHTVQRFGGLQQIIEKKKWQRVADAMHIPKAAQDRVTKLYDAYCKYLVPYDTLSEEDKKRLEEEVMISYEKWTQKRMQARESGIKDDDDDDEEISNDCVMKGRSMCLSSFYRIARNTMAMWYKKEPTPEETETVFWKIVTERTRHLVVHAGNIDSSVYGSGFPCNRNSLFSKHAWNLKVLTNNPGSILRCMGPVSGVTIPTLHVGMLFTTGCWYRDPHSLPWIEYLHTGASKIWYSTPESCCEQFRAAMKKIMPDFCTSNPIWLPSDTAMVPPDLLIEHGATLSRTVQDSGQFIVIFPGAFTSTICCGYTVSESVYFAPPYWLDMAQNAFKDIRDSCESPAFSLERLFFCIANDSRTQLETLVKILPMIEEIRDQELQLRKQLYDLGLKISERLPILEVKDKRKRSRGTEEDNQQECEICRSHCYVSMVLNSQEEAIYCLQHACQHIQKKKNLKFCKLIYTYDQSELNELIRKINDQIQLQKNSARKKSPKKKPSSP